MKLRLDPPPGPLSWVFPEWLRLLQDEASTRPEAGERAPTTGASLVDFVRRHPSDRVCVPAGPRGRALQQFLAETLRDLDRETPRMQQDQTRPSLERRLEGLAGLAPSTTPPTTIHWSRDAGGRTLPLTRRTAQSLAGQRPDQGLWFVPLRSGPGLPSALRSGLAAVRADPTPFRAAGLCPLFLPEGATLDDLQSTVVVYEVEDPDQAIDWFNRGADMVETFDIGSMITNLAHRAL